MAQGPRTSGLIVRAALALASTVLACGIAYVAVILVFPLLLGRDASNSFSFLAMTGIFSLAGWLLVLLPLVLFFNPGPRLFHPAVFPWAGAAGAVLVFLAGLAWMGGPLDVIPAFTMLAAFAGYAAVVGLLAGLIYSLLQRSRHTGA